MPRVCIRLTAARSPRRQELFPLQKTPSRVHKLRRCDAPRRVDGSRPQKGGGTWSRLAYLPGLCETSRLLLPVWVTRAPRRCCLGELFQRCYVPLISYQLYQFPNVCWALLEIVVSASFAGSTSAIDYPEVSCSLLRMGLSRQSRFLPWLPSKRRARPGGP